MKQRLKIVSKPPPPSPPPHVLQFDASVGSGGSGGSSEREDFALFDRARGVQCNLKRGDMLYIPPGWWHQVDSYSSDDQPLQPTIAVNIWWRSEFSLQIASLPSKLPAPATTAGAATSPAPSDSSTGRADSNSFLFRSLLLRLIGEENRRLIAAASAHPPLTSNERKEWFNRWNRRSGEAEMRQLMVSVRPSELVSMLAAVSDTRGFDISGLNDQTAALLSDVFDSAEEEANASNTTDRLHENLDRLFASQRDASRSAIVSELVSKKQRDVARVSSLVFKNLCGL